MIVSLYVAKLNMRYAVFYRWLGKVKGMNFSFPWRRGEGEVGGQTVYLATES